MIANKHISKIIIALMTVAVALCFVAIGYSSKLAEMLGDTTVRMEYETKLFNTDEVMEIDIQMDEDEWEQMLDGAMSEEYHVCNVVINGKRVNNVAIRPKGNTSLSAIAMDSSTDRYSLKLEFDHYVKGQTCYGLDKLILNNNYADATNMKEAIIYDMYQYIGATSSLYNYAKVSVNGEYWGVYLALEGVEQSFMLRNFGTQDGELYKPDSMDMGDRESSSSMPNMGNMSPPSDGSSQGGFPSSGSSFDPKNRPRTGNTDSSEQGEQTTPSQGDFPSSGFNFDSEDLPSDFNPENMPDMGDFNPSGKGGFSMGGGGANLNYSDDDLDSYSIIWEGEVTNTGTNDHRKVVTALKNISEGTDLETYLNVDNILKYMAVHVFSVNMDSLSGSMSHNYYLYEYNGQLDIFPWDYNLSLGGMSMGNNSDATEIVNDAIDTPFSGTKFFDALLNNEEYLEQYHAYLQQLVEEYVNSGRFEETYNRIRNQIDELVETDPTAFYSYEEYETAAEVLHEIITLRAESIKGQLNGTIPSSDSGQKEDSSSLIDASHIDVKTMGQFNMGGSSTDDFGWPTSRKDRFSSEDKPENAPDFNMEDMPEGFSPFQGGESSFSPGDMPFSGTPGQSSGKSNSIISFGICFVVMIASLIAVSFYRRRKYTR